MNDRSQDSTPGTPGTPEEGGKLASLARRRQVLRSLAKASAVAGAASPLSALATGNSTRGWCHAKDSTTVCVTASKSGCHSVMQSAQKTGTNQHYGNGCSTHRNSAQVPATCRNLDFKTIFSCTPSSNTAKDSMGNAFRTYKSSTGKWSDNTACAFNMTPSTLCATYPNSSEAHWVNAYINATRFSSSPSASTFPYDTVTVVTQYNNSSDPVDRADYYAFFVNFMERGKT